MIGDNLEHIGNDKARLTIWNPREVVFAEQWDKMNKQSQILAHLLNESKNTIFFNTAHTERDIFVAATIIQWLGTNIGQGFLEETQNQIAKRKEIFEIAQQASYRLRGYPVTAEQSNAVMKK
jgi:hypothetical protein